MGDEMTGPSPGWFERQQRATADDVASWPAWMRREAGLEGEGSMGDEQPLRSGYARTRDRDRRPARGGTDPPTPTKRPVPANVLAAARRMIDAPISFGNDPDLDALRDWYFAGRAPGPGPGVREVAAWAMMMAAEFGVEPERGGGMYQVKVERDSVGPDGSRLTTFVIEFPRVVLAETVTHRMNSDTWGDGFAVCERTTTPDVSKNSASSRAIPHDRFVAKLKADPYLPAWTGAQKGMQGGVTTPDQQSRANAVWLSARDAMLAHAEILNGAGVHKQDSNRLLEPWAWVTQVVTSTGSGWSNFFALRCHEMAHPAFRKVARMMFLAMQESTPDRLARWQWHLPFVPRDEALAVWWAPSRLSNWRDIPAAVRQSPARCAWVSYESHEKDATPEAVDRTCERLVGAAPVHASPFEHQGTPNGDVGPSLCGNLPGWVQLRKLLPAERAAVYAPSRAEIESWPEYQR